MESNVVEMIIMPELQYAKHVIHSFGKEFFFSFVMLFHFVNVNLSRPLSTECTFYRYLLCFSGRHYFHLYRIKLHCHCCN